MKTFFLLILLCIVPPACSDPPQNARQIPDWLTGTWAGSFGFEHDVVEFKFIMNLKSKGEGSLFLPDQQLRFQLAVVEMSAGQVRFNMRAADAGPDSAVPPGIMDLIRLPDLPEGVIHVQFYPDRTEALWLGQARRTQ